MAELEELEQEELDKNLLEISGPETVPLPNVPSVALPSKPSEYAHSQDTSWPHEKGLVSWSAGFHLGSELKRVCYGGHRQCHLPSLVSSGTGFPNLTPGVQWGLFCSITSDFPPAASSSHYHTELSTTILQA